MEIIFVTTMIALASGVIGLVTISIMLEKIWRELAWWRKEYLLRYDDWRKRNELDKSNSTHMFNR